MASIARQALENTAGWADIAALAAQWAAQRRLDLRSVIVLVPFLQHLGLARRAWAARGGWQPRIETTRTLAASLGPATRAGEGQLSFDVGTDRLNAARMLRSQSWRPRDPLAFDQAVAVIVETAHDLARAAAALPPAEREGHWRRGRDMLSSATSVGGMERALARLAMEWAAFAPAPATDRLFDLQPQAWIVVQVAGPDAQALRLMETAPASVACLLLDADPSVEGLLPEAPSVLACNGFEDEAARAATQVISHLLRGEVPIALAAQDRLLMRRIRALLERQQVRLQDETGWTLSTTRAAAELMSLLRAAAPRATTDALLEWLKSGGDAAREPALDALEARCRREAWAQVSAIRVEHLSAGAARLFSHARQVLDGLTVTGRQTLSAWLSALQEALRQAGVLSRLEADAAGAQLLQVLHLNEGSAWPASSAAQTTMDLVEFTAWVDSTLEQAAFLPPSAPEADVVITPLARLPLRPFAAVVFPGADDRHLASDPGPHPLLDEAQAQAFGLPSAQQRRSAQALAFSHLLARSPVSFFHRRSDGAEPLARSPLLERLALRLERAGLGFREVPVVSAVRRVTPAPLGMPAPSAADLLPTRLSASACEALRACPYRFHALHLLRVREADELDAEIEQRDYGSWLHAVLMSFHSQRSTPADAEVECARLLAIAREHQQADGFDDADFLPFEAAFIDLAPRYIEWLHQRDAEGTRWRQGELEREAMPEDLGGLRLHGRIDRVDELGSAHGGALELIDYKTGNASGLREKVRQPLEDTQLAFYAALLQAEGERPLQASYLVLGRKIEAVVHPEVERSAHALVDGLGHDLARMRRGEGLPALGQPPVCDYCEARGLCRRDHWSTP
jgi:ATP-dependent helicase/nuclease subunit B